MRETLCPVCSADIPLSGEERGGDILPCPYCSTPLRITAVSPEGAVTVVEET